MDAAGKLGFKTTEKNTDEGYVRIPTGHGRVLNGECVMDFGKSAGGMMMGMPEAAAAEVQAWVVGICE